jgi:hypothetical protein
LSRTQTGQCWRAEGNFSHEELPASSLAELRQRVTYFGENGLTLFAHLPTSGHEIVLPSLAAEAFAGWKLIAQVLGHSVERGGKSRPRLINFIEAGTVNVFLAIDRVEQS